MIEGSFIASPFYALILSAAGVIIGGLITWLVSLCLFKRSSRQIRLILRGLEEAGLVKWNRDKKGRERGLVISASVELSAKSSMSASGTVTRDERK